MCSNLSENGQSAISVYALGTAIKDDHHCIVKRTRNFTEKSTTEGTEFPRS